MTTVQELVSGIVQLIPLPKAYLRVRELVKNPRASASDIADVIATDPSMTVRLLRIANSPYFGFSSTIETVQRAISVLGNDQVHDLALAASAISSFSRLGGSLVDITAYWRRSVHCAVLSRSLGVRVGYRHTERLFVTGLLHNVGHLILCHKLPDLMEPAIQRSVAEGTPLFKIQREVLGFDYAQVGGELLRVWLLPEPLQQAVASHVSPGDADQHVIEASTVHVASVLVQAVANAPELDGACPEIEPVALQLVGLPEEDVDEFLTRADAEVIEAVTSLLGAC